MNIKLAIIADSEFESHVTNYYPWSRDKLIIGKFCQIAAGVEFVMNGANHQMNAVSTFPFYTLEGWEQTPPTQNDLPIKGDTIIGNDVWIGQNATILPGVHIGDGAIIGANSVVGSNVDPYTIVVGNPAKTIRKRFDDELIDLREGTVQSTPVNLLDRYMYLPKVSPIGIVQNLAQADIDRFFHAVPVSEAIVDGHENGGDQHPDEQNQRRQQKEKDIQLIAKVFFHILCSFPVKRGRGFSWDETHDEASPLFYRVCLFKQLPFSCRIRQPDR